MESVQGTRNSCNPAKWRGKLSCLLVGREVKNVTLLLIDQFCLVDRGAEIGVPGESLEDHVPDRGYILLPGHDTEQELLGHL